MCVTESRIYLQMSTHKKVNTGVDEGLAGEGVQLRSGTSCFGIVRVKEKERSAQEHSGRAFQEAADREGTGRRGVGDFQLRRHRFSRGAFECREWRVLGVPDLGEAPRHGNAWGHPVPRVTHSFRVTRRRHCV